MLKIVFFISGFCSLLYQVVWQRLFGLACSSDNVTAALVVSAFLSGLGLGNLFAAKISNRLSPKAAFRMLALCETLTTLFAFLSPYLYYDFLFAFFLNHQTSVPQTFLVLFVSLLPPTFLMGMSMPLLGRAVVQKAENTAAVLGSLYAVNIVGAGTGAFIGSFCLLGMLGMEYSLHFGGVLNLCIAFVLWMLPQRFMDGERSASAKPSLMRHWRIGLCVAAAGAAIFIEHEVTVAGYSLLLRPLLPGLVLLVGSMMKSALPDSLRSLPGAAVCAAGAACLYSFLTTDAELFPVFAVLFSCALCRCKGDLPWLGLALVAWLCFGLHFFFYLAGLRWLVRSVPEMKRSSWRITLLLVLSVSVAVGLFALSPGHAMIVIACVLACFALFAELLRLQSQITPGFSLGVWFFLAFAAGCVSVSLELVWFRTLFTLFRGNSYVFGPLLGVFLLCDGLGMWAATRLLNRIRDRALAFFCVQAVIAAGMLLSYVLFIEHHAWGLSPPDMMMASIVLMGIPCFFMGFTFPLIQAAVQDRDESIGSRIGVVLFANTLGNAVGGAVAAFVLLGYLGTVGSIFALAGFSLLVVLYCIVRRMLRRSMLLVGGVMLFLCALFPGNIVFWEKIHGMPAASAASIVVEDYSGVCLVKVSDMNQRYYLDSPSTLRGTLYVSGHRQGDIPFGQNQTISGVIGSAFHPEPKSVLCIGVGSAATPFLMGMRKSIDRIEMVELVEAEIPALRAAAGEGYGRFLDVLFSDEKYVLHIADGRKVLFNSGEFDIIQADMRTAETSGSGALYSREFYLQVLNHLKPDGYFIQQTFGGRTQNTMRSVFPYTYSHGLFTIGARQPIAVSRERLLEYTRSELSRGLAEAGLDPRIVEEIIDEYIKDSEFVQLPPLDAEQSGYSINTDLFPMDEFYLNTPVIPHNFSAW